MYVMADFRYNHFYSSHLTVMDDRGKKTFMKLGPVIHLLQIF